MPGSNNVFSGAIPPRYTRALDAETYEDAQPAKRQFTNVWWLWFKSVDVRLANTATFSSGTHANRPSPSIPNAQYYETDRGITYISLLVNGKLAWVYLSGVMAGTLSPDLKPTDLGTNDAGFQFDATDYQHRYRWTGTGWNWAYGENGAEYRVAGTPTGGLWAPCNGAMFAFAQSNGTLVNKATPDFTTANPVVIMAAPADDGAPRAATNPSWAAGAKTANESNTHTHSVNISDGGSVTAQSGVGTTFRAGLAQVINTGTESAGHTHNLATDAVQNPPSEANGGMPLRFAQVWFMRR